MKVVVTIIGLLLSSQAGAQECKSCSEADACKQTYVKAAAEVQRATKVAVRDWQQNLKIWTKRPPQNSPTGHGRIA
jgi:hypothetical protein